MEEVNCNGAVVAKGAPLVLDVLGPNRAVVDLVATVVARVVVSDTSAAAASVTLTVTCSSGTSGLAVAVAVAVAVGADVGPAVLERGGAADEGTVGGRGGPGDGVCVLTAGAEEVGPVVGPGCVGVEDVVGAAEVS